MRFDAVVFSGGGCRCFWQAGFWSVVAPALELRPRTVLGASAGSAFACAAVADRLGEVVAAFTRRTARNPRNVYPSNVMRRRPVFPHEAIYRGTIMDTMDAATLARLHHGPDLRLLVARPPARQSCSMISVRHGFGHHHSAICLVMMSHTACGGASI